jgi:hypothetical protein
MNRTWLKLLVIIAVLTNTLACSLEQHRPPAYDGWSLLAPLPVPNSEIGVAELDGKIYVIGGYPGDRKTVATVQVYDSRVLTSGRSPRLYPCRSITSWPPEQTAKST